MGMDGFAPFLKKNGVFIVRNITSDRKKTIKIFNYPINYMQTRDLLQIPGVAEADIRASLLKGELLHKILAKDIVIEMSDIDLLQFNDEHKQFLKKAGITLGLTVGAENATYLRKEDGLLLGAVNGFNKIFNVLEGVFVINNLYTIIVYRNGVKQAINSDYYIAESGGINTGYDTIIFFSPPDTKDVMTADYYINQ